MNYNKSLLLLLLISFFSLSNAQIPDTCLIINEIAIRPCCGFLEQKTREYVELFNVSYTDTIDINGWYIQTDLNNTPTSPLYGQDEIIPWSNRFPGTPNDLFPGQIYTNTTKIPPRKFAVIFAPAWNTSNFNLYDIADSTIALTLNNFLYWGSNSLSSPNGLLNNAGDFVSLFNNNPSLPSTTQIDSIGWDGTQQDFGYSLQRDNDCIYRFYKDASVNPAVSYTVDADSTLLMANSPGTHNTFVNDTAKLVIIISEDTVCTGNNISYSFTEPYSCTSFSYLWNFGDPTSGLADTSSSALPSHSYNIVGIYTVSLIVTSDCFIDTISISITANPTATFNQSLSICSGQSITVGINTYTATGVYNDTLASVAGCDSILTTNLTVSSTIAFNQSL
ncbi:MAG: PKD domain-containing protein, partial [Flavobacteriales bacterium]|nr:PKD domain-containing protein [Flavobacteriales bacterium]